MSNGGINSNRLYANTHDRLTMKQKQFAEAYVRSYNATHSILENNPTMHYTTAATRGASMLRNPKVKAYINELNGDLARMAQLPKLRLVLEQRAVAFSNISDVYKNWQELKDFDSLSADVKSAIAEIDCKVVSTMGRKGEPIETRYMRVRMHDKLKALENLAKLMGYNEPERIEAEVASIHLVLGSSDLINQMEDE